MREKQLRCNRTLHRDAATGECWLGTESALPWRPWTQRDGEAIRQRPRNPSQSDGETSKGVPRPAPQHCTALQCDIRDPANTVLRQPRRRRRRTRRDFQNQNPLSHVRRLLRQTLIPCFYVLKKFPNLISSKYSKKHSNSIFSECPCPFNARPQQSGPFPWHMGLKAALSCLGRGLEWRLGRASMKQVTCAKSSFYQPQGRVVGRSRVSLFVSYRGGREEGVGSGGPEKLVWSKQVDAEHGYCCPPSLMREDHARVVSISEPYNHGIYLPAIPFGANGCLCSQSCT